MSPRLRRSEWLFALGALALNGAAAAVSRRWLRVPAALGACAATAGALRMAGASAQDLGLSPKTAARGGIFGALASVPIAVLMVHGARNHRTRLLYAEERIRTASLGLAVYESCIRVPFGTALPEELLFRGCLPAVFGRERSFIDAAFMSSLLFGFWHIAPTLQRMHTGAFSRGRPPAFQVLWLVTTIGATSASGLALAWLRTASGSLVAPWMAHSTANSVGLVVAWLASHRTDDGTAGRQAQR